ncbi:MAG TPA: restriction endonuclease subunit S [Candidatus Woesebacteria bacterium]|nr:restriction endonuclease subunit S [Candidatus Woesebacteria bacterium]
MAKLKPCTKYKESGVDWLGEIPEDWKVNRTKVLFKPIDERSKDGSEQLLSVSEHVGVKPRNQLKITMFQAESYEGYKLCQKGDLVINSLWAWKRGLGFSEYSGIVSTAYGVYRPKKSVSIDYKFFHYLYRTKKYVDQLYIASRGIWKSRMQLSDSSFLNILVAYPEFETQIKARKYLEYKEKDIDKYIKKLKKEIALLKEYRQKIISQAVTCGLDENGELRKKPEWNEGDPTPKGWKDSGVEWMGLIPEGWELLPGRAFFSEKKIKNVGMQEKQVLSLSYGKIIKKKDEDLKGLVPESFETYQIVSGGDIIIRSTDLQNDKVSLRVGLVKDIGIITSAYLCLKVNRNLTSEYAYHLLHSYDIRKIFYSLGSGLRQNLSITDFKFLPIVQPPHNEQKNIVSYVIDKTESIDKQISEVEKQINYIQEYKQSLISKVVTGKIDVRNINNNLSED